MFLVAQVALDVSADLPSRLGQVPRDRGLVLPEGATDLRQRQILCVVVAEPEPVLRGQPRYRRRHRAAHQLDVLGDARLGFLFRSRGRSSFFIGQRFEPTNASDTIDVTLREHGTQPRAQTAAAVKVLEERSALAAALGEAEEFAIQRVRQFPRTTGGIDGIRCSIQHRTMLTDEVLPGAFVPIRARAGERQIFQM